MLPIAIFRHAANEGPGYLAGFLDAHNIPWKLFALDAGEALPSSAADYSGLVFMGGPMSVNDDLPWITQELDLIREAVSRDIPVLGHCLGAQLIAKALGGVVSRNAVVVRDANGLASAPHPNPLDETTSHSTKLQETAAKSLVIPQASEGANESLREIYVNELGWGEVQVADNDTARAWFGDVTAFEAFHWHGETFTLPPALAPSAIHLLSSEHCKNQAFAIGKTLALQCHIEMTAPMVADWSAAGADEIAASITSPAVQTADAMCQQAELKLPPLQRVAERLYQHWVAGLRA